MQSTVYVLLPPNDPAYGSKSEYYPLSVMLSLLWLFQLMWVSHFIFVQVRPPVRPAANQSAARPESAGGSAAGRSVLLLLAGGGVHAELASQGAAVVTRPCLFV